MGEVHERLPQESGNRRAARSCDGTPDLVMGLRFGPYGPAFSPATHIYTGRQALARGILAGGPAPAT
jgi:hypothetical protein